MSTLFLILGLVLAFCAAGVVSSFAFYWYEAAFRDPTLMERRSEGELLRFSARLVATELLCLYLTVLLHPLGWFRTREDREGQSFPGKITVILLHGLFHNRGCWWWVERQLRRRGIPVFTLNLHLWRNPEAALEILGAKVDELTALGAGGVILAGHSMGGLIARSYLGLPGNADKVKACVLLATPNAGSRLAPFALSGTGRMLLPGSSYLLDLAAAPAPAGTRIKAIYSRHDNLVIPWESGRLEDAENLELQGVGHTAMLYRPETVESLVALFREENR